MGFTPRAKLQIQITAICHVTIHLPRDLALPSMALAKSHDSYDKPHSTQHSTGQDQQDAESALRIPPEQLERELVLVGLVGLEDPLREDVPVAISQCARAGVCGILLVPCSWFILGIES